MTVQLSYFTVDYNSITVAARHRQEGGSTLFSPGLPYKIYKIHLDTVERGMDQLGFSKLPRMLCSGCSVY